MREIQLKDLDKLYEIYAGKGITDYMEGLYKNRIKEEAFTKAYIENMYYFYGYGIWVVCLKENDEIIGRAGISNREVDNENKLELGYVIAVPYQHKKYAYEACEAICRFAKDELLAKELVCFIEKDNITSIRLAKKLKFEFVKNVQTDLGDSQKMFAYYKKIL